LCAARDLTNLAATALSVSVVFVVSGCSDATNTDIAGPTVVTSRIALSLPSGSDISSVRYRVLSSGNATLATGTIDVSDPGATLSLDLVLAPAVGDVVELSAETSTGALCTGASAPFDVTPEQPTFVGLTLICGGDQPGSASCPNIQSWSVTPVQTQVPLGTIGVGVTASDPGGTDSFTYVWIATAGAFVDSSAASTVYTCTTIGQQTLTLTVRDVRSTPACAATATFLVNCVSGGDGGSSPPSAVSAPLLGR
jgi:hypothetical protein